MKKVLNLSLVVVLVSMLAACSGRSRVPFEVYSEPLGAHVIMRSSGAKTNAAHGEDWIYLGVTPLKITRVLTSRELDSNSVITLRVMRAGVIEQMREWSGDEIRRRYRDQGMLYWNAQMVPSRE